MKTIRASARNPAILLGRSFACLVVFLLINDSCLEAQGNGTCVLEGTVKDPDGGVVPGARILLEPESAPERQQRRRIRGGSRQTPAGDLVFTDGGGFYCFSDIDPGLYHVRVTAAGFNEKQFASVMVRADEKNVIDVALSLAVREEVVTVTATATRTTRSGSSILSSTTICGRTLLPGGGSLIVTTSETCSPRTTEPSITFIRT